MPKTLNYNVRWAQSTFSNRAVTESLLAPERDVGNVSSNDYEAALQFNSSSSRHYYRHIGGLIGVPATIAFRKPSWSHIRTFAFLATATMGGILAGEIMNITAHYKFVRSLENPSGFAQAIENIQNNAAMPVRPGPTIIRNGPEWTLDTNTNSDSDPSPIETSPSSPSTSDIQQLSVKSKWDQIRAANTRASTNSSWDALRQSHERSRLPPSDPDFDVSRRTRDQERAVEQAKFDEMLERERNIKPNA
ncbi:hypothetical protein H0H93_005262 [Arthromyces matolae]|nr:hypothetical protein H0H93_005262 [Arthromyces matolae]